MDPIVKISILPEASHEGQLDTKVSAQPTVDKVLYPSPGIEELGLLRARGGSVILQSYSDSFYLNSDLESLLNRRGFSTQRPEIIGMFNYIAPLERGSDGGSGAEYIITPSGELYDYQCQLKQMRYSDADSYFKSMLGISSENGKYIVSDSMSSSDIEFANKLISKYTDNMEQASSILDYLSTIYFSISSFIDSQDLNSSHMIFNESNRWITEDGSFIGVETAGLEGRPGYSAIFANFPALDLSINANVGQVPYTGSMNFIDFLTDVLGLHGSISSRSKFRGSSGSLHMLSMFNVIAGSICGLKFSPGYGTERGSYTKGVLPGYNIIKSSTPSLLNLKDIESYGVYTGADGILSTIGLTASNRSELNSGLFDGMISGEAENRWGRETIGSFLANLCSFVSLDTLQTVVFSKNSSLAGTSTSVSHISTFIEKSFGRSTSSDLSSILVKLPTSADNLTRYILTPNKDVTSSDTRSTVEAYTQTNAELADGVSSSRTGRSYYCDEIPTLEFDDAKDRIQSLTNSLSLAADNLKDYGSLLCGPTPESDSYIDGSFYQYGYEKNAENLKIMPSTFYHYLLKGLRESTFNGLTNNNNYFYDIKNSYMFTFLVAAMASEDSTIAYYVGALNVAYCEYQDGKITNESLKETASVLEWKAMEKLQKDILNSFDSGEAKGAGHVVWYGDGEHPDGKIEHEGVWDQTGGLGSSSDYFYYPIGSSGIIPGDGTDDKFYERNTSGIDVASDTADIATLVDELGGVLPPMGRRLS